MQGYNYNSTGAYFITICINNRQKILSSIATVGADVPDGPEIPRVVLTQMGEIADKYIKQLSEFYKDIAVEEYVIMPNHIHALVFITEDKSSGRSSPTAKQHSALSRFVSTFKRFCNKEYGRNVWQRSFHDRIIRDDEDRCNHLQYIRDNPLRWHDDELYC